MNKNDHQSSELSADQLLKLMDMELELKRSKRKAPNRQGPVLLLGILFFFALLGLFIFFALDEARSLRQQRADNPPMDAASAPVR